eukprot:TRINITY_DN87326_c0_g1_i1.p1 TRINITY_DN87326_c0_g1~~TRINITY_DN87326_c0_g1_i1.p1  ORF type:complete len:410 (-),score=38.58 TRINITY_DN87326_c0_g1_i1:138-1367(-)
MMPSWIAVVALVVAASGVEGRRDGTERQGVVTLRRGSWWRFSRWGSQSLSFTMHLSSPGNLYILRGAQEWSRICDMTVNGSSIPLVGKCINCASWSVEKLALPENDLYSIVAFAPRSGDSEISLVYTIESSVLVTCLKSTQVHMPWVALGCLCSIMLWHMACSTSARSLPGGARRPQLWDEAWVPKLWPKCCVLQRPPAPTEPIYTWWLHSWPCTWVWFPWRDEVTTRGQRAGVLITQTFMTALLSQAYVFSAGVPIAMSSSDSSNHPELHDPDQTTAFDLLVLSTVSSLVNQVLRQAVLLSLKASCHFLSNTTSLGIRFAAGSAAAVVVLLAAGVPLAFAMQTYPCARIKHMVFMALIGDLTRLLLIDLTLAFVVHLLLRRFGVPTSSVSSSQQSSLQQLTSDGRFVG